MALDDSNNRTPANGSNRTNNSNGHEPAINVLLATSPNDLGAVPNLLEQIAAQGASLSTNNYEARLKLLATTRSLVQALETPRETMLKHVWAQPSAHAAITTLYEAGVCDFFARQNKPTQLADCAAAVHIDRDLLTRLMRHLGSMGYMKETGPGEYVATNFIKALCLPIIGDGYPCVVGGLFGALNQFHNFSKEHNYQMVTSHTDTPLQYAENMNLDMFAWLQKIGQGPAFNHHMAGYRQGRPSWMDPGFYPVQERLVERSDTSGGAPFLVDIGGGIGHDLTELLTKHANIPGRLILEDLPVVIGQIQDLDERIERVPYDFLTEQPHKGARAYYLHSVLHDWPDDVCARILANITAAMKPGYSRLLINENVIPDSGADWQATALDIMMLTLFSSRERTIRDWQQLLGSAGLRIVKVWGGGNGTESLVECELAVAHGEIF